MVMAARSRAKTNGDALSRAFCVEFEHDRGPYKELTPSVALGRSTSQGQVMSKEKDHVRVGHCVYLQEDSVPAVGLDGVGRKGAGEGGWQKKRNRMSVKAANKVALTTKQAWILIWCCMEKRQGNSWLFGQSAPAVKTCAFYSSTQRGREG